MSNEIKYAGDPEEVHTQFMKTRTHITPGYGFPMMPELQSRRRGLCLHHSYVPELPVPDRNYAEIFNKYHFGNIKDWKWDGARWVNPNNSWYGLRYDFVVTYKRDAHGMRGSDVIVNYWTSYRWIAQLGGGHSRNPKRLKWKSTGRIIMPNTELVSVCVVGDYDKYPLPAKVIETIKEIAIKADVAPHLFFHRDFDFKTCPGAKVNYAEMRSKIFGHGLIGV